MNRLIGYGRALRAYLATPKGAFDAKDYGRALFIIFLSIASAMLFVQMILGE
ncbi:MAG: DUF2970 domain-containing protein [Mitsuokella multacida]|jgi:hypothetical protein